MPDGPGRVNFQDLFIAHADDDRVAAIEAGGIDADFLAGEKPAHGQRFKPSLAVPLLDAIDAHPVLGGEVGEGGERMDVVGIGAYPAADG